MKRGQRSKAKLDHAQTVTNKPYPEPHRDSGRHDKRDVTGSINVSGKIEAQVPPSLVKEYATSNEKQDTRENKRFVVECVTLAFVIIYASLTFWQSCSAKKSADAANASVDLLNRQFKMDQRPRVSINGFTTADLETRILSAPQFGKPIMVDVTYTNSGKTAALHMMIHRHLLLGDDAMDRVIPDPEDKDVEGADMDPGAKQSTTAVSLRDTYSNETAFVANEEMIKWDGSESIILFGRLSYLDSYGTLYCTPFIAKYMPQSNNWLVGSDYKTKDKITHRIADFCPKNSIR